MNYLVGDLQGCDGALSRLLDASGFSPSRDRMVLLGDLVNRGPGSLAVLQRLQALGDAATCLLGNHDLHLLAVANGAHGQNKGDTLSDVLESPSRPALLEWLRNQRMACMESGWLCVHAGVVPQWDTATTLALAGEVEATLQGPALADFLRQTGSTPAVWDDTLSGSERLRFLVGALTRIRFCSADGTLDFKTKDSAGAAPPGLLPWFAVPGRRSAGEPIAFGHWSTLGLVVQPDLLALDTGCVWGGSLTAVRVDGGRRDVLQVPCDQARQPGV